MKYVAEVPILPRTLSTKEQMAKVITFIHNTTVTKLFE